MISKILFKFIIFAIFAATNLLAVEKELSINGLRHKVAARSTGSSLNTSQRDTLLRLHNDARKSVRPASRQMPQMIWNNELASIAQAYANKCIWDHNSQRSSQSKSFSYVGENLYVTTASNGYLESGVASWVNEKKNYNYAANSCRGVCGHYTQVVWAKSKNVGCAVGNCATMTNLSGYRNAKFLVCNYGPGGNIRGQKPYAT